MWKFGLVGLLFLAHFSLGQDQFLREVTNPSGPSQVLLSGGVLNRNIDSDDSPTQLQPEQNLGPQEQEAVQPQSEQAIPFQTNDDEQPIPQNEDCNNPFDNGNNGFGLRLSEPPGSPQAQPPPPTTQPAQQQSPVVSPQQQQPQTHAQQGPVLQQAPLILPPLPAGHQYVDEYGRPIIFTQPAIQTPPPQPSPTPAVQVQQPAPVQKQAFVDVYGRQIGDIQTVLQPQAHLTHAPAPIVQEVIQPSALPVAHHHILEHAAVGLPVVEKKVVAPPPLTLHTYAVPAIHKVGNLAIPYAQKVVYAKQKLDGVVFPPTVNAPAIVKSKHRTVFSPIKVVQPVATPVVKEVVATQQAVPVVHQHLPIAAPPQQILIHQQQSHLILQQQPQHLVHVEQSQVAVQHPQPLVQFYHHQPPFQYIHHGPPQAVVPVAHHHPVFPIAQHPPVQYVEKHLQQLVHLTSPPVVAHPPVLLKKVTKIVPAVAKVPVVTKTVVPIPDFTLIHQPILSKVLFQRHIFNVKHGSEPLIYQDLCTVYPYQKNLRACALKKATLPELHHPDIRAVNVQEQRQQPQPDQSIITGGAAVIVPAPMTVIPTSPTVTVTRNAPKNIQDTIRRESAKSRQQAVEAAAATNPTTTVQPEAAESRTSSTSKSSRRKKGSNPSPPAKEKEFKLA